MTFTDKLLLAILALGVLASAGTRLAAFLEERHNTRLARIVGAASRIAGTIRETLQALPPNADPATAKAAMVRDGVRSLATEFAGSAAIVGATPAKLEGIIAGELGKLPPVVAPAVLGEVLTAAPAALTEEAAGRLAGAMDALRGEVAGLRATSGARAA